MSGYAESEDFMPNVSESQKRLKEAWELLRESHPGLSNEELVKLLINPLTGMGNPLDDEGIEN